MELKGLKTEFLGRNLIFFPSIDSTQKKIKSLKQPSNGTIVIADNQVEGVGTHERKWYTGNGKNIAMSFVLFPDCQINKIRDITISIADCLVNVLEKKYKIKLKIKEPNDIYYQNKKLAGILTQTVCKGEMVKKVYIGIGLNVNQDKFPGNLSKTATSLKKVLKKELSKEEIIVSFLNEFEKAYKKMID